ncbi:MAG: PIN domain-containing protein [Planctomycetaceae bacterium]|jgi:predicted nucleic acid-binding protein|nr:PIN domain-containing protein [Planctomycetaceae bacterium]
MKLPIVVDTCIFSYDFNHHTLAVSYARYLKTYECLLSFQSIGELYYGAIRRNWSNHKKEQLRKTITENYTIIHSDDSIIVWFAFVMTARQHQPISIQDAWIAATALAFGCPLLTHNARDFENIPGLEIITEYTTEGNLQH